MSSLFGIEVGGNNMFGKFLYFGGVGGGAVEDIVVFLS